MKSWIEISRERLAGNIHAIRTVAGEAEVLAVVKADGYGHDVSVVAPVLAEAGVRWLGVSDVDEGVQVRRLLGDRALRLLVMVGMEPQDAGAIIEHGLTPMIWTPEHVAALEQAASVSQAAERVTVHLEVDTGMARQGAAPGAELEAVLDALKASRHVRCEGLMTHFAESEVAGSAVTTVQMQRFEAALRQVRAAEIYPELLHAANSSAVDEGSTSGWLAELAAKKLSAGMLVRPGYAIYGHCLPVEHGVGRLAAKLEPVLTWKTRVIGLREVEAGATVGYGATFVASQKMRLALLPVGYADGFRRAASSGVGDGWVMLRGKRAVVVGRVSMNLTVVDVTTLKDVVVGDEVTLLGEGVSAEDHARWAGTIGYDILCGIRAKAALV